MSALEKSIAYSAGCQSIDEPAESSCSAITNSTDYTQSTWHTFTTDNHVDYIAVMLDIVGSSPYPVGYRLYQGDVRNSGSSLTQIGDCKSLADLSTVEYICDLNANTTYSIQLLFHTEFDEKVELFVRQLGDGPVQAPKPETGSMANANQLGSSVPANYNLTDHFSCASFIDSNVCGAVNPSGGVPVGGNTYDLTTWVSFGLNDYANVAINLEHWSPFNAPIFGRLFADSTTNNCGDISLNSLFAEFNNSTSITCMPPGSYSLQLLGQSQIPGNVWNHNTSNFGRPIDITIDVAQTTTSSQFDLAVSGKVDNISSGQALVDQNSYNSVQDIFGCDSTVLPAGAGGCNPSITKAIYRELSVGDGSNNNTPESGVLTISNLATDKDFQYEFFQGSTDDLATGQGTFTYGSFINGLISFSNCIDSVNTNYLNNYTNRYCVTSGDYSLVTYGTVNEIGSTDQPVFQLREVNTIHDSPANAENLDTIFSAGDILVSEVDYFSCIDNAVPIAGVQPCHNATKAIYREFYLDEKLIIDIDNSFAGVSTLFQGRASDAGIGGLSTIGNNRYQCFYSVHLPLGADSAGFPVCDSLLPGWYTVVNYGRGPNYSNAPSPDLTGEDIGDSNKITVSVITDSIPSCNRPQIACGGDTITWGPNANTSAYPDNDSIYYLDRAVFSCPDDLPFSAHPIDGCNPSDNRTAYYVFTLTQPSFLVVDNLYGYTAKVFDFDARSNPNDLISVPPIQPCMSSNGFIQLCNVQPGTYTLVIFANDSHIWLSVKPRVYIDSVGISKFDHAKNAYDFDFLPGNNQWYSGLSHLALSPGIAPSNDYFFCSTGAQNTDPDDNQCYSLLINYHWDDNPNVYPFDQNYPLFLSSTSAIQPRRNLWYTFKIDGVGRVDIKVDNMTPDRQLQYPFAIYKCNGLSPDSAATDLTLVGTNRIDDCNFSNTLSFANCDVDTPSRYMIVIDNPSEAPDMYPNSQVEVAVRYDSVPVRYDHCYTANVINGLNQIDPPYTDSTLTYGEYMGDPGSFLCATADPGDSDFGGCDTGSYSKTLWYKFEVGVNGRLRIGYEDDYGNRYYDPDDIILINDNNLGNDNCDLSGGLQIVPLASTLANGSYWGQVCAEPGIYYIMLTGCNHFLKKLRPLVWVLQEEGDNCSNAISDVVNGNGGSTTLSSVIDCHTMGGSYGEDGSDMACLIPFGANINDFKSTWFEVEVTGQDKYDVTFSLPNFNIPASQIRFRVLSGACGGSVMNYHPPCVLDGNSSFELPCVTQGIYYIQVVTPVSALDQIRLNVTSKLNTDVNCNPIIADFNVAPACNSDSVFLTSSGYSSSGPEIDYYWTIYDDGNIIYTSTARDTFYLFPRSSGPDTFDVKLMVENIADTISNDTTKAVVILPHINLGSDTILCAEDDLLLQPYKNALFTWQDGTMAYDYLVTTQGTYWAEDIYGCRDTIVVDYRPAIFTNIDTHICEGDSIFLAGAFRELPGPYPDTLMATIGCDSIVTIQLHIDTTPLSGITTSNDTVCRGEPVTLTANGGNSYSWSNGNNGSIITVSPTSNANNYWADISTGSCTTRESISIHVNPVPIPSISGNPIICPEDTATLSVGSFQTYSWSTGDISNSIMVNDTGVYKVTVTNVYGCTGQDSFQLSHYQKVEVILMGNNPKCTGDNNGFIETTPASGTAPFNYQWSNGNSSVNNNNLTAGIYALTVTDNNGCSYIDSLELLNPFVVTIDSVKALDITCTGYDDGIIQIFASGGTGELQFSIDGGLTFLEESTVTDLTEGNYQVVIKDSNNCLDMITAPLTITEPPPISVSLAPDSVSVAFGEDVNYSTDASSNAVEPFTYNWIPAQILDCIGCPEPTAIPIRDADIVVELEDSLGCVARDTARIYVDVNRRIIKIPNIFTPNGDRLNDRFYIMVPGLKQLDLKIFNRWGEMLFATSDINEGWDGTYNGDLQPPGVYVYSIDIKFLDDLEKRKWGSITLIR